MKNIIYTTLDGIDLKMKQALQYVIDNLKAQNGEIDIVNLCIILIGFRARIVNKVSNLASDTSRSLPHLLSAAGVRSKLKLGGSGFQEHFFIKKGHLQEKFIYGGYTTQLSLKLLNSECL